MRRPWAHSCVGKQRPVAAYNNGGMLADSPIGAVELVCGRCGAGVICVGWDEMTTEMVDEAIARGVPVTDHRVAWWWRGGGQDA